MNYYVFTLRWSQTDNEQVIVQATSEDAARQKLAKCNARYIDGGRVARLIV